MPSMMPNWSGARSKREEQVERQDRADHLRRDVGEEAVQSRAATTFRLTGRLVAPSDPRERVPWTACRWFSIWYTALQGSRAHRRHADAQRKPRDTTSALMRTRRSAAMRDGRIAEGPGRTHPLDDVPVDLTQREASVRWYVRGLMPSRLHRYPADVSAIKPSPRATEHQWGSRGPNRTSIARPSVTDG